jgi:3-mercaptopyruvate sulfurtransferase SseA
MVHLPNVPPKDPAKARLKEATLLEIVDKTEEVVFYGGELNDTFNPWPSFACAKALTWGFTRVYYFPGGIGAWNEAGYPVETGE